MKYKILDIKNLKKRDAGETRKNKFIPGHRICNLIRISAQKLFKLTFSMPEASIFNRFIIKCSKKAVMELQYVHCNIDCS